MMLLASLTSQEIVYENLSKQLGINQATIDSWLSVLQAGDIIYLLQPYNEFSISKRILKKT